MRNIFSKGSRFVVLVALLLSGCFRPAGDSIPPTSSNDSTNPDVQPITAATTTPAAPPITLLSPDTSTGATATMSVPALTEVTVIPFESTATPTAVEGTLTATLQIITPGSALDIITPETPTPLPTELPSPEGAVAPENPDLVEISSEPLVSGAPCTYTVQPGDSLYRIAILNDTNVAAMMNANPELVGNPPILQPGQVVRLSDCTPEGELPTAVPLEQVQPGATPIPADMELYRVQPGDTLYQIAIRFGVTVNAIMQANNLSNPNSLSIGQELMIPGQSGGGNQ